MASTFSGSQECLVHPELWVHLGQLPLMAETDPQASALSQMSPSLPLTGLAGPVCQP